MEYIDLVTETGELIRVECPEEHYDECWETVENTMKVRGFFAPSRWEGCTATYLGMQLDRVNMGKVVATL